MMIKQHCELTNCKDYENRLYGMNMVDSFQFPQIKIERINTMGRICSLEKFLGGLAEKRKNQKKKKKKDKEKSKQKKDKEKQQQEEKSDLPELVIKNEALRELCQQIYLFPNITKIERLTYDQLKKLIIINENENKNNCKNKPKIKRNNKKELRAFKTGILYVPTDPTFRGIDYCFLIWNITNGKWYLFCVQAKSAPFDISNWGTDKADEIVIKADNVLGNIDDSICAVFSIKNTNNNFAKNTRTEIQENKIKDACEKNDLEDISYDKCVFVPRECIQEHFGPQYEHVLRLMVQCAVRNTHEKGKASTISGLNRSETVIFASDMNFEIKQTDSDNNNNSNNRTGNCFICHKKTGGDWIQCGSDRCAGWCHKFCLRSTNVQAFRQYVFEDTKPKCAHCIQSNAAKLKKKDKGQQSATNGTKRSFENDNVSLIGSGNSNNDGNEDNGDTIDAPPKKKQRLNTK